MASSIEIRPVEARDIPSLIDIVGSVFEEYGMTFAPDGWDRDLSHADRHYAPPNALFLVASRGHKIMGMAGGHLEASHAELHRLYLSPRARGFGLGVRLCAEIENWAKSKNAKKMILWSDVRFTHAHALYKKRGYQIFSSRRIDDPDHSVEFGMERNLSLPAAPVDDPLSSELRESVQTIELEKWPELRHKALFTATGILDSRKLVIGERLKGEAHELLPLEETFQLLSPSAEKISKVTALVAANATIVGFQVQQGVNTYTVWHPSCRL